MDISKLHKIQYLTEVYGLLVVIGGASVSMSNSFIVEHSDSEYPCTEWRFQGWLGFGGKYRFNTNTVDYYIEHQTPERDAIMNELDIELAKVLTKFKTSYTFEGIENIYTE